MIRCDYSFMDLLLTYYFHDNYSSQHERPSLLKVNKTKGLCKNRIVNPTLTLMMFQVCSLSDTLDFHDTHNRYLKSSENLRPEMPIHSITFRDKVCTVQTVGTAMK